MARFHIRNVAVFCLVSVIILNYSVKEVSKSSVAIGRACVYADPRVDILAS
jgi:hypothetical protein